MPLCNRMKQHVRFRILLRQLLDWEACFFTCILMSLLKRNKLSSDKSNLSSPRPTTEFRHFDISSEIEFKMELPKRLWNVKLSFRTICILYLLVKTNVSTILTVIAVLSSNKSVQFYKGAQSCLEAKDPFYNLCYWHCWCWVDYSFLSFRELFWVDLS